MMDAGSRTYANLIEKQDIDSHKDNSFDKLHIHTLKSSASLKLLHEDLLENSPLKLPVEFISPQ